MGEETQLSCGSCFVFVFIFTPSLGPLVVDDKGDQVASLQRQKQQQEQERKRSLQQETAGKNRTRDAASPIVLGRHESTA